MRPREEIQEVLRLLKAPNRAGNQFVGPVGSAVVVQ